MAAVYPNEGLPFWLNWMLNVSVLDQFPWQLVLFQNELTPDQGTVWADLEQSTFAGYGPVQILPGEWDTPTIQADQAVSKTLEGPIMWQVLSAGQLVHGHAIATSTDPVILLVEQWIPPVDTDLVIDVGVWPHISLSTQLGSPGMRWGRGVPAPRRTKRKRR